MAKPNFTLPNKPAIKSGSILSYNYTDDFTFVPAPLTFNRDSAATRVNEKGLIEDVGYFGPELVQNGDFSEIGSELVTNGDFATDSDWTKGTGWSISNGVASYDGGSGTQAIKQSGIAQSGKTYKISLNVVSNEGSGSNTIYLGGVILNTSHLQAGSYTFFVTTNTTGDLNIFGRSGENFVIDNVSVKEVGQNWTFGTGASMGDGKVVVDGTGGNFDNIIYQDTNVSFANKKVKIKFDVLNYISGKLRLSPGNSAVTTHVEANGSYEFIVDVSVGNDILYFINYQVPFVGSIDNVSVIEVLGDKPRIDYSDSLTEPSLLLEPQSTNLISYSEDFSQSNWLKGRTEVLLNTAICPDGNFNAATLSVINATGGEEYLRVISSGSSPATCSIYVKKGNWRYITIRSVNISVFDFDTETFTLTGANETLSFEKLKNGWYRLKASSPTRTYCSVGFAANATSTSGSNVNGSYMYIWGAQLEELSYVTSYIPTAGSTATRLGETANNAGDVNVFNSEEGVLYAEFATISKNYNFPTMRVFDGTNNNAVRIFPVGLGANNIQVQVDSGGSISFVSTSTSNDPTQYNKIAVKYQKDNFSFYINGTQHATDNSGNAPVGLNKFEFQSNFFGKVRNIQVFNKALTDRELEILTIQ